jgi:hypothetical protein
MPLGSNKEKTAKQRQQGPTQPVASTRAASACLRRNHGDGATCNTRRHAFASLHARLENPSQTCFHAKQAARSRRVSHADLTPSVLWRNQ